MVTVKRANVILDVKDSEVEHYFNIGYDILDENGNVIRPSVPKDIQTLQKAYVDDKAEIKALLEEVESLKDQLAKIKKQRPVKS